MEPRRRVTEEDLLITEAFIAKSYNQLKQSVIETPSRAFKTVGQTVQEHPFAAAGAAVVAGVAVCGIVKMITPSASVEEVPRLQDPKSKDTSSPDLMHEIILMILPLVVPYVVEYILKWNGGNQSGERV